MAFLPAVVKAKHRGGFRVELTFNDGLEATLDFKPWLDGPVFGPLKTLYEAAVADRSNAAAPDGGCGKGAPASVQGAAEAPPRVSRHR